MKLGSYIRVISASRIPDEESVTFLIPERSEFGYIPSCKSFNLFFSRILQDSDLALSGVSVNTIPSRDNPQIYLFTFN